MGPFQWSSGSGRPIIFQFGSEPEYILRVEGRQAILSGPDGTFTFDLAAEPEPHVNDTKPFRTVKADDPRTTLALRALRWKGSGEARTLDYLRGEILLRATPPRSP